MISLSGGFFHREVLFWIFIMDKMFFRLLAFICILGCFPVCSDDSSDSPESNILYNNKIIDNDDFFANSHWNDPHVLNTGGQFVMYASSDSYVSNWDGNVRIFRFISDDGKSWTITNGGAPVLALGSPGQWDEHCTETPAVVYFDGKYHMFYTGYNVAFDYSDPGADLTWETADDDNAPKRFKIGHATSPDGITWTRVGAIVSPSSPYTDPNFDFNQYIVGEPGPVVFNGKIYLYFTAVGGATEVGTAWQTIGLVKSNSDATSWTAPQRVLTPDLNLYPRTSGDKYSGYSTPNAAVLNGRVHLFFDVALNDPWKQVALHHAVSTDGETGWLQDSAPLLERKDYSWTADEIRSPMALEYNNDLYLYFAGHYDESINPILCIGLIVYDTY